MRLQLVQNPPNPWRESEIDWEGEPPPATFDVLEQQAKSILSKNESPDLGFRYSLNPYQGCYHGCSYCYARPTHQYWDFGAGTDFARKIIVKTNAAELLKSDFDKPSWKGELIVMSGNNDAQVPQLLKSAAEAGASHAFMTPLRLPGSVFSVFKEALHAAYPDRADKVIHGLEALRDGNLQESRFDKRMQGQGERWALTAQMFRTFAKRLGLRTYEDDSYWQERSAGQSTFIRPGEQLALW